jgi:hypothetical protein
LFLCMIRSSIVHATDCITLWIGFGKQLLTQITCCDKSH